MKAKLRKIDIRQFVQQGKKYLLLRDPLNIALREIVIPAELGPLLSLLDGTRDVRDIQISSSLRFGMNLSTKDISSFLETLEKNFFLETPSYKQKELEELKKFRSLNFREPLHLTTYAPTPEKLSEFFNELIQKSGAKSKSFDGEPLGLLSPHIDYFRGGEVYARVWKSAEEKINSTENFIVIGTDHFGDDFLTLTYQYYSTPWGVLPTHREGVDFIKSRLGEDVFKGELRHKTEHSLELAIAWLHFIKNLKKCQIIPILTGDMKAEKEVVDRVVECLSVLRKELNCMVISAGDLSHVGVVFGGMPFDLRESVYLKETDQRILQTLKNAHADSFLEELRKNKNSTNVCGLSAIYLNLASERFSKGEIIDYLICPADERGTSVVSICGCVFLK